MQILSLLNKINQQLFVLFILSLGYTNCDNNDQIMRHIISQTPLRISLFGGGTDYPAYYQRQPGAVLGFTIDQYVYVSLNTVSRFFAPRLRISYSTIEEIKSVEEIQHPSVRACLKHKQVDLPLDIHISADLPAKTGLGSSSAFTVGFLNALHALQGTRISKDLLAQEACHVEQALIQERVGSQDQYHAAFGGINVFEFSQEKIRVRPVIMPPENRRALENHLFVFYTGLTRFAHEVVEEQLANTDAHTCDAALLRMYEMVFEAEQIFSKASAAELPQLLGSLLHEGWGLKKKLSKKISNPWIDEVYEKAIANGAAGGKLCGAGGGGFLVFLIPTQAIGKVKEALKDLPEVPFRLESHGSTILYMKE